MKQSEDTQTKQNMTNEYDIQMQTELRCAVLVNLDAFVQLGVSTLRTFKDPQTAFTEGVRNRIKRFTRGSVVARTFFFFYPRRFRFCPEGLSKPAEEERRGEPDEVAYHSN